MSINTSPDSNIIKQEVLRALSKIIFREGSDLYKSLKSTVSSTFDEFTFSVNSSLMAKNVSFPFNNSTLIHFWHIGHVFHALHHFCHVVFIGHEFHNLSCFTKLLYQFIYFSNISSWAFSYSFSSTSI